MDSHDVAEHAKLLSHHRYAKVVDEAPEFIEQARRMLDLGIIEHGGTVGQQLWSLILRRPWPEVRDRMLDEGPEGRLLRSNSPFSQIIGVTDPEERLRLWRTAKSELLARKTSTELSAA